MNRSDQVEEPAQKVRFVNGMTIRSSDDNTGHVIFDGDWVLESPSVDVNLIPLYFNETILDVEIVLDLAPGVH